ncbi:hypothetical protein ACF09C_27050 [Streptomyces sp. NPDC014870]|uniref:hypothetical protein n=1 Tax=Streptomyces sp. NPDC014870 TaxID=3364925 RepID=UPI0036FBC5D6
MSVTLRLHRHFVHRSILAAGLVLALSAPVGMANAAVAQPVRAPSQLADIDLCRRFEQYSWTEEKVDKTATKAVLRGLVWGIGKTPWGRSHGLGNLRLPPFTYGAGSTLILGFAKASCPRETLVPAAQSLQYLSPDRPQQQPTTDPQDYNTIFPAPTADNISAQQAAEDFNISGATGMTGQRVLNLSLAMCIDTKLGEAKTDLRAYLGRADLRAHDAAKTLVSLTRKRCPLSPVQTEVVAGRLNDFLVFNQELAQLPPFLVNPTWACGATPEQATLRWTAAGANPITQYELYHLNADGTWTPYNVHPDTIVTSTIGVTNLASGIHDFALRATDDQGNQSGWVTIRTDQQLCEGPANP